MTTQKLLFILGFLYTGAAMAVEEPTYSVESKNPNYEIRNYAPVVVAETKIDSNFENAGNQAFRILAGYIFGANQSNTKIAMTAPVSQSRSEKIEMTAPVAQTQVDHGFMIQFTMPNKYTLETLPTPTDPRVHLRSLPPRKVAVLKYSGSWSESRYLEKLKLLREDLKRDQKKVIGEPVFARYNSPFQIWFLRRNEIWLEIKGENNSRFRNTLDR